MSALTGDAVQAIAKLAQQAQTPTVITLPNANGAYLVSQPGYPAEVREAHRKPLDIVLDTPNELAAWLGTTGAKYLASVDKPYTWEIYLDVDGITAVNTEGGEHRLTVPLHYSHDLQRLEQVATQRLTQSAIIKLLNVELRANHNGGKELVTKFRQLNWSQQANQQQTRTAAKESMGKSLVAEVLGELPEELRFFMPVYDCLVDRYEIMAALESNPSEQTLTLTPYPADLRAAKTAALEKLRENLEGALVIHEVAAAVHLGRYLTEATT